MRQARTLADLFTDEEKSRFDRLYHTGGMTSSTAQIFADRFASEIDDIDYRLSENARVRQMPFSRQRASSPEALAKFLDDQEAELKGRRARAFETALDGSFGKRGLAQLLNLERSVMTGYASERFKETLAERGVLGVAEDVATSLITSVPRGIAATAKTLSSGFGERPIERIGEMTGVVLPLRAGTGLAAALARASGRKTLASTLGKAVSHPASRAVAWTGESADILGAEEDVFYEGLLEVIGEGTTEGLGAIGRGARDSLQGEAETEQEVDPVQQRQQQRPIDNDAAAAATAQRARGAKAQAALDALAFQLVDITEKVAAGKDDPSVDDIYRITPQAFVEAFENHVYPEVADQIAALEAEGVYDAENGVRARILELHQQIQQDLKQHLDPTGQGQTPEQAAGADLAGQQDSREVTSDPLPEQEAIDETTETVEPVPEQTQATDDESSLPIEPETQKTPETPTEASAEPSPVVDPLETERDWAGVDADIGNEVLETLSQDPDADMETAVDAAVSTRVENQTLSPEDGDALKAKVVEQITPAVAELRRNNVPPARIGPETVGYWSDEDPQKPIHVRPIVRELDDVVPSHDTEGNLRSDYPEGLQPREQRSGPVAVQKNKEDAAKFNPDSAIEFKRNFAHGPPLTSKQHLRAIIAGTGRRTMLEIVREHHPEKWAAYQQRLREELETLGMDPGILDAMDSPVLTYELVSDLDEVELAKDTNRDSMLGHSSAEEATFDRELLSGDVLYLWNDTDGEVDFTKTLESPENENFRTQIIGKIPKNRQSEFLTSDNKNLSEAGEKRLLNAMIRYVFSGDLGESFGRRLIDRGSGGNITLDAVLLNAIPSLAKMKMAGIDISEPFTRAVDRFIDFDNTAADEASSEANKNRDTGPLTKEELLWRNIETSFASISLLDPSPLIENQLLYLLYAKKKGNAYKDAILAFRDLSRDAIALKRHEPDADVIANTEQIATRMIIDYLVSEAYVVQAEQQSVEVLIDRMPPEVRDIRRAYEDATGADAKKTAAEAQIMEILKLMNEGQEQQEVDPNATQTDDTEGTQPDRSTQPQGTGEQETATTDTRVVGTGPGTPGGPVPDTPQGTLDRDATGTPGTPESQGAVAPAQPGRTDRDDSRAAQGAADDIQPDDRGSDLDDGLGPRFGEMSDAEILDYLKTEKITYIDRSADNEWANYRVGRDFSDAGIGTGITVQLRTPQNGNVRASLFVIDRNTEVITRLEKDIATTSAKIKTAQQFIETLTVSEIQAARGTDTASHVETTQETTDADTSRTDTTETGGQVGVETGSPLETEAETRVDDRTGTVPDSTQQGTGQTSETTPEVVDTNQVVGVSRRIETTQASTTVSPVVQRDLDALGITTAEWAQMKAEGTAIDFINNLSPEQQEQVEWAINLTADINQADAQAQADAAADIDDFEDLDDEDLFSDVIGTLKDITDQQRSDFDNIRRKLFLGRTIARLEAKGQDRTVTETAQLRALTAPTRTDAQQEIYERLLTAFVDGQVTRLASKSQRSATENRILEALTAVQAEGLPKEASERSLNTDLETPDQEHSRMLSETRTLAGVQAPATADTALDLPESVTADTTKLSPAQQTSVKAIIAAFKRKIHTDTDATVQGGFLLGEKPGVGKTRQALAAIWHYIRQGVNRHFILAPNPQLLNNYSTDMQAMGGDVNSVSHYDSGNQQLTTPIGTATYNMLTRKPNLANFTTPAGTQNAIADIVQHLTGVRPTLQQTHPETYQTAMDAYRRILGNVQTPTPENVVTELRRQAQTVNLDNAANVEQFRQRLTPRLADLLLSERTQEGQQELLQGTELAERVKQLLSFGENILFQGRQPDPDFAEKAAAFEGVIVLDEMHKTAGTDSQIGQMIAKLHELLPNAKFLYMSATPFKEIDNFWVADRLGLWGANQPFPTFTHFRRAFRRAARAVKEVIPLHLKQTGRYLSRALSSKETRYTPVEVPLTDTEKAQYDTAVQRVQGIRQRFEGSIDAALRTAWGSVIDNEGQFHQYKAKYMRMFYGETQKFFLAVLDSMKAQGLTENIREKLLAGDKVIVQLENTWEATTERAAARGQSSAGPFDLLIDFVSNENMFPIHEHQTEVRTRRDGSEYTVVVPRRVYDANGQQVRSVDPSLKRLQTEFLNLLQNEMQRAGDLQFAADIIHQIASEAGVASGEISGRRNTDREALATAFSETTDVNMIVLGPAGLTGINLPVSESIKDNVGALYHYLVQSSWNVNTFEQGLGRGKRANSAIDPHYMIAHQDLPGADRVLGATLAKFAEMGALAGQADNALMQNIDKVEGQTTIDDDPEADVDTDVFDEQGSEGERAHAFGTHGQEALDQLWYDIYISNDFEIADTLGLTRPEEAGGTGLVDPDTVPSVQQFFSRLLHQSTENQPRFYQQFEERLKRIITYKKELGQLDVGAGSLDSKDGQIVDRLTVYTDPDTGQTAEVVRLNVKRQLPRRSWDFTQKVVRGERGYEHHGGNRFQGIYTDADGNVWAVFELPFREDGEVVYTRWGPRGTPVEGIHEGEHRITAEQLQNDFTAVREADAQRFWEAEDASADTDVDSELFMATGLILPKWQDFATRQYRHAVMGVIPMLDGSNLHGRVIPSSILPEVLTQIGGVDTQWPVTSDQSPVDSLETGNSELVTDIDIPSIVREIIGEQTDTKVAARLNNIVEHIHKNLPLRLRGHLVRSAAEAALLGQLIRDPQVEHTWIVYRKDDRIVKIEPISLNKKGETSAGDFAHIKRESGRRGADSILRIHNHPSGVAKWSGADKRAAMQWHKALGTLMAEDIIVDSGTYAYRTFENGEYTWHEDTVLEPGMVEWATGEQTVSDPSGEQKSTDVLYQNPLIRGAREAATYMMGIKRRTTDVAELIFVDNKTGKIVDTWTDTTLKQTTDPMQYIKSALMSAEGQQVHIAMWGDDTAVSLARSLQGVDGVDSVWVNAQRVTGIEHIGQDTDSTDPDVTTDSESDAEPDTITITVGDQDHTLVRMPDDDSETDTDTLSDVITDLVTDLKKWWNRLTKSQQAEIRKKRKFTKSVMIAGVRQTLHPDPDRRLRNRFDRGIDAEHMTGGGTMSGKDEAETLQTILQSGVVKATHPVGPGEGNAYFSYGPFYRRNENRHDYGVILDLEKILRNIPGITATIHRRGTFGQRKPLNSVKEIRQALRENQIGHPDTVIEIIVPQDVDINTYFAGVVMDGKAYAQKEYLVENQLTGKRLPSQQSGKSEAEVKEEVRKLKDDLNEHIADVKPAYDKEIAHQEERIQREENEIRRREDENKPLKRGVRMQSTKSPMSDKNRISTNEYFIKESKDRLKNRKKLLNTLQKYERPTDETHLLHGYVPFQTSDQILETRRELKKAERDLKEIQTPRQRRKGVLLRDVGGKQQEFVKVEDTLSDVVKTPQKKVVVVNVSHNMVRDPKREDRTTPDRAFPSDAEHMTAEENFNQILQSGVLKPTTREYEYGIVEADEVFLSHGRYYRNNPEHGYGLILDLDKLQKAYPSSAFRVHPEAAASGETHQVRPGYHPGTPGTYGDTGAVEFVVHDTEIPINDFLIGIVDNHEVYIKPEYARTTPEGSHAKETEADLAGQPRDTDSDTLLRDYQPSAETPHINRATRAMPTQDQLTMQGKGRTRKWLSPQSQLFEKLRLATPKLREYKRVLTNAVRSGYGALEELKAPLGSENPGPGDIIEDMLDQRMRLSGDWTGRTRSILTPVLKKLQAQVKRTGGADAKALRAAVDFDIIEFIERNTPLRAALRAFEPIAKELKEAWRKVNQSYLEAMIQLIRNLSGSEEITKFGENGRQKWSPEPMYANGQPMTWDWSRANGDGRFVDEQGTEYTIAEAFERADGLWYPHQYDRDPLRHYNRRMEELVKALNELAATQGDQVSGDALDAANVEQVSGGGYRHKKLDITFPDLDAVIRYYTNIRDRTEKLLKMYDDGTIGIYPHLERVRETHDRLYKRETNLLMSTSALLWDRFAELNMFGQISDLGPLPDRLSDMLIAAYAFNANAREAALMAVVDGLQEQNRSEESLEADDRHWGMHESIPAFTSEGAALRIMQQWEDYYIDKDGNKVKTGKWKGIDMNRLGLDQKTLGTLEQIGFIQPDGQGGWKVYGKTDAAQQTTIARFFVEVIEAKTQRQQKVEELIRALGYWQQKDPLTDMGGELWKRMNTAISIGALGPKQALQNLTEIPAAVMMTGTKAAAGMVKELRDPNFREAISELVEGAKQGIEFLADDNLQERYLNSAWSLFGYTERVSRMWGIGVGLIHARTLSRELLASKAGSKDRGRIQREMRRLRMNPETILEMPAGEIDAIYTEMIQRIKSQDLALSGVELPSAPPPQNALTDRIGDEWVRSAMFVSDSVFKPYDARTLPPSFNTKDPFMKIILKFKGWMLQMNSFIFRQYKQASNEAIEHRNFRPLSNMLSGTLALTGSVGATQAVFAMLQGRSDEEDKLLKAFLHTQTLGLGSVLLEMALRSEDNPWRLEKTIEGTVVGPVWGTFADIISPTATGDLDRTLQEVLQRTPGAREMLQVGANQWWEGE